MSEPAAPPEPRAPQPDSTRTGPGRLLVAIYALFALAASARAGVQIATKFGHAPVAYVLSAFAGLVYILATVTLAVGSPAARRIAVVSCSVELAGVLAVGTWSLADPATFPDATVWSGYRSGLSRRAGAASSSSLTPVAVTLWRPVPPDAQKPQTQPQVSRHEVSGLAGRPASDAVPCQSLLLTPDRCGLISRTDPRTKDQKKPDRLPAIRPLTCNYLVAGAGFEPATSGL